ncbi:hypothetical protein ABH931_001722 [Streptacidiphilus sp. MAP12-33]|uniref:hypothetical protein n=1 Tax=Streptacidiphilus sp. MAP12-33 TaxID=3156266 RepID=UPI0035160605
MTSAENIHPDMVIRARVKLLNPERIGLADRVWAYRILGAVEPGYLPRLVEALVPWIRACTGNEHRIAVTREAVAAARRIHPSEPKRLDLLCQALDRRQSVLHELGRRGEGRALREELAALGRPGPLAVTLAEEGRHAESAEILGRLAANCPAYDSWRHIAWSAELEAAGRPAEAIAAATALVARTRARLESTGASLAMLSWELTHLARLLDAFGAPADGRPVRAEIHTLLTELAATGERRNPSNIHAWWCVLLGVSGRADEPEASGVPSPAFGEDTLQWSPGMRQAHLDGRQALADACADLAPRAESEPGRHLSSLVTAHRRLTIRESYYWTGRSHRVKEPLGPFFDRGVELARRLATAVPGAGTAPLIRALTDRSGFRLATREYAPGLTDFREAEELRAAGGRGPGEVRQARTGHLAPTALTGSG